MNCKCYLMREILFRGKRLQGGNWVEGYFFKSDINKKERESGKATLIFTPDCNTFIMVPECHNSFMVVSDTVGQYTGLKDKNGKKVFEGDIVRKTNKGRHPEIFIANIRTCFYTNEEVYYGPFDHFTESCEYEIIGNIYDNPELLEK